MKTSTLVPAIFLLLLGGCGVDGAPADAMAMAASAATGDADPDEAAPLLLDEDLMRGDGCPVLSAGDVAELARVPAAGIGTSPMMDCYYEWGDRDRVILSLDVHRDADRANEWFESVTADYTAEEMQAAVDTVMAGVAEKVAEGEIGASAIPVADALASAAPTEGGDPLAGIGDRASATSERLYVLRGNATFDLKAERNDTYDAALTRAVAQRVVDNLERL